MSGVSVVRVSFAAGDGDELVLLDGVGEADFEGDGDGDGDGEVPPVVPPEVLPVVPPEVPPVEPPVEPPPVGDGDGLGEGLAVDDSLVALHGLVAAPVLVSPL